jgi:RNA polymerase primary sigma factor
MSRSGKKTAPYKESSAQTGADCIYAQEAKRWKLLTREEEKALATKCVWDSGNQIPVHVRNSREEFFKRNMRLVISMSKKYGTATPGVTQADLIQEGSIGLMRAIEKFDHTRGVKFSTYAVWWIRQAMTRTVYQTSSLVRLPTNVISSRYKLIRIMNSPEYAGIREYETRAGVINKISEDTGWEVSYIEKLLDAPFVRSTTDDEILDTIPDSHANTETMDLDLDFTLVSERVNKTFKEQSVPDRDVSIFWDWITNSYSLSEIGLKHGITRERTRQVVLSLISRCS